MSGERGTPSQLLGLGEKGGDRENVWRRKKAPSGGHTKKRKEGNWGGSMMKSQTGAKVGRPATPNSPHPPRVEGKRRP